MERPAILGPGFSTRALRLELKTHCELQLPRGPCISDCRASRGYLAECAGGRTTRRQVRIREVGMVQEIEGIYAHDQRRAFSNPCCLFQGHIRIRKTRTGERVAAESAEARGLR